MSRFLPLSLAFLAGACAPLPLAGQANLSAEQIIDRYVDAMGGRAALSEIRSVRLTCLIEYPDGTSNNLVVLKRKPNLSRIVIENPTRRIIQAYDGEVAWIGRQDASGSAYFPMAEPMRSQFIREATLESPLVSPHFADAQFERIADTEYLGRPFFRIKVTFPEGDYTVFYIDHRDFLERRILEYSPEGELIAELVPSDFQKFDGVLFAMRVIRIIEGETVSALTIRAVEVNIGILEGAFSPPVELANAP